MKFISIDWEEEFFFPLRDTNCTVPAHHKRSKQIRKIRNLRKLSGNLAVSMSMKMKNYFSHTMYSFYNSYCKLL